MPANRSVRRKAFKGARRSASYSACYKAFTLVELLVVIGIITLLAAILVPTVMSALNRAKEVRISLEISQLAQAVEEHKLQYGAYPPDFANGPAVMRHIRRAFPRISNAEILRIRPLLWNGGNPITDPPFLDAAEALPFWLGGFSDEPAEPFTGSGGPFLFLTASSTWVANPDRNRGAFEFDQKRLTLTINGLGSDDEIELGDSTNDLYPIFYPPGRAEPYIYFHSLTYIVPDTSGNPIQQPFPRLGTRPVLEGTARPYFSVQVNPNVTVTNPFPLYFVERKKFQILCAGMDGDYGLAQGRFPSGGTLAAPGLSLGYVDGDLDNLTSFAEGKNLEGWMDQ